MAGSRIRVVGTRVAAVLPVVLAMSAALGCTADDTRETAQVLPLDPDGSRPAASAPTTAPLLPATSTPSAPPSAGGADPPPPAATEDPEVDLDEVRAAIDDALLAYDRALTALVGRPGAAADPADPLRVAWDRAVGPLTSFSSEMLATIRQRYERDRVVIRPDASGLAYRHRALVVTEPSDGTVSFTWCGHSPGVGHDADSGAIVDDGVAHARGTGLASLTEGRWRIDSLDEFELDVLPAGSPDPCPSEVAESAEAAGAMRP